MARGRAAEIARALRDVVRQPGLRRAEVSFALAVTSETAFTVTLAVIAFRDGGAAAVGLVALLRMVPSAIGSPILAAYADRARRAHVLVALSMIRVAAVGASALLVATAGGPAVYALAVVATVSITVFRPVHSALMPLLCREASELTSANVVRGMVEGVATLLGPAIAGVLLTSASASVALGAVAALSFLSALSLVGLDYDEPARPAAHAETNIRQAAREGIRAVVGDRDLRLIFGLGFAQTFVRGALNVFIVVVALELLDNGEGGVAGLSAAVGAGGIVGALAVTLLIGSRHLGRWLAVAVALWGAPIAVVGLVPNEALAFAMLAVVGLANALIDVPLFSLPVRFASDSVLARAFGVFESLVALGVGLGSLASPALIELFGLRPAIVGVGLLLPVLGLVSWRRLAELDGRLKVKDEEIRLLRATPMLALLPVPTIEHLATRLRRRVLPAGTVVCAEGEPGASFFVVCDGKADALREGGHVVSTMGPGDGFGEIALMRNVPRTVTVRARTELTLFELDRDDFLHAVAGHRPSADAAENVIARHLSQSRPLTLGG